MKVLVIGSGGREHALVWKLAQSRRVKKVYCAPGNGGISAQAECVPVSVEDTDKLINFAKKNKIDLTVVGPEVPLSIGVVDEFEKAGLKIFGPKKNAAVLESSKCFTKEFCSRHNIPAASCKIFTSATEAKKAIESRTKYPVVVKADGLAAGKGVTVAKNRDQALKVVEEMMVREKFGQAGRKIILEEFLKGEEATFMVATDGKDFVPLESAQDHKPLLDNDKGPNTGGMGAYSPAPLVTKAVSDKIVHKIIQPLLKGMRKEDRPYRGILYAGLMIDNEEPYLVEFNCRFGDPEAQPILYRLESDLVDLIERTLEGKIKSYKIAFRPEPAVCVVMSSDGYPSSYEKGKVISGLDKAKTLKNIFVFHAGTKEDKGQCLTNGGRVLGVTARGNNLKTAISTAYKAVGKISWDGAFYRKDIGKKALILNI